jgi:hypothetical protein
MSNCVLSRLVVTGVLSDLDQAMQPGIQLDELLKIQRADRSFNVS